MSGTTLVQVGLRLVNVDAELAARNAGDVHVAFRGRDDRALARLRLAEVLREIHFDDELVSIALHVDVLHLLFLVSVFGIGIVVIGNAELVKLSSLRR